MSNGLFEDQLAGKVYDKELFKRLIRYLKPYTGYVVFSFFLLLLITAAELSLPLITKHVVDEYIASNKTLLIFHEEIDFLAFKESYPKLSKRIFSYNNFNYALIPSRKASFIASGTLNKLKQENKLITKIIIIPIKERSLEILEIAEFAQLSNEIAAISQSEFHRLRVENKISRENIRYLRSKDLNSLKKFGIIAFLIVIIEFIVMFFQIYYINHASQHAMYNLRKDVFSHLTHLPLSFFDKNPVGRLVTRVTNDVRTLDEMLSNGLIQLIQEFLILAGILVMMVVVDWQLALATFTILPIVYFMFSVFIKKSREIYREVRRKVASINASLAENISGVKIIQLFNQYQHKVQEFAKINREYYDASMAQLKIFAIFRPLINSMQRVAVAIVLWYGGGQILSDRISLGVFILFLSYIDRFFEPINQLSEKFNILQAAMSGAERIFDLMDKEQDDYRVELHKDRVIKGEIEFQNVWLRYNDNGDVLKNISFTVKAGEKVALVGHTGSGKTSIISLITGLYPFQKGKILIDGRDILDYSLQEIRAHIGIVQQDVFLFSGTIKENILLNNPEISDEEMKEFSHLVNVDKFIDTLPKQYYEPVMERGATLSVGQRQLIAFARVLAYNPAIFVLDEATSNIDTETELLIQDALKKVMENRTSIIIAHRLSTIQHVDKIIVIHKGEIREEGSHQELLAKKGLYYDLYRLQYT
jgi:ATP-binding cassette subfamily B protein/subfamily B ATP-binding cassette protein MsbA